MPTLEKICKDLSVDITKFHADNFKIIDMLDFSYLAVPCRNVKNGLFITTCKSQINYYYVGNGVKFLQFAEKNSLTTKLSNSFCISSHNNLEKLRQMILEKAYKQIKNMNCPNVVDKCYVVGEKPFTLNCSYNSDGYSLFVQVGCDEDSRNNFYSETIHNQESLDIKNMWNISTIPYPVRNNGNDCFEMKTISMAWTKKFEDGYTDSSLEEIHLFTEACFIGYQQVHGSVYNLDKFIRACVELYTHEKDFFDFYVDKYTQNEIFFFLMKTSEFQNAGSSIERVCKLASQNGEATLAVTPDFIKQAGQRGESQVDYVIQWTQQKGFSVIPKDCTSKYHDRCIVLIDPNYSHDAQEFDHILVFNGGIVNIETKNYGGKIEISSSGQWIQEKNGKRQGIESPVFQVDRHHDLLKSVVGDIPIFDIICIANAGCEITGIEHCPIPVVKYDMLKRHLEQLQSNAILDNSQIQTIIDKINISKIYSLK